MGGKSYKTSGIVLRKTKLGETDLAITYISDTGERAQAVAKGARKPGGSYAARLELYSQVDLVCASGRSLDVVTDARLVAGAAARFSFEQGICAAPVAELLASVAQPGLENPRLYAMAQATFAALGQAGTTEACALAAAALVKIMAQCGFRPHVESCIGCSGDVSAAPGGEVALSLLDGGFLCSACQKPSDAIFLPAETAACWRHALYVPFADLLAAPYDISTSFALLHLDDAWVRAHAGVRLKSLEFLFGCGLF